MMNWLDIRSGGVECIFTKQYLDEAMDTESVSGFNTLYDKDQVSTDSGEDETEDNPPSCGKRGRGERKGGMINSSPPPCLLYTSPSPRD